MSEGQSKGNTVKYNMSQQRGEIKKKKRGKRNDFQPVDLESECLPKKCKVGKVTSVLGTF